MIAPKPYVALSLTEATSLADVIASARTVLDTFGPLCPCGTTPDLIVETTAGETFNLTDALREVEMALRSGIFDRVRDETLESASEYVLDRATAYGFDAANRLRKRLARTKATSDLAVRPGLLVSREGIAVAVVGVGHLGATDDRLTLLSAADVLEVLTHLAPRQRGIALLDTLSTTCEVVDPTEYMDGYPLMLCTGDTEFTVYCSWEGEPYRTNTVLTQFGPPIVGEA